MKQLLRLSLCGGVAAVLTVLFVVVLTRVGSARVQNSLDLLAYLNKWSEEARRREDLQARTLPVVRRTVEKHRIVENLLARQLTLREAARQFRELDEDVRQVQTEEPWFAATTEDDDGATYRNVFVWVQAEASVRPEAGERLSELEQEMAQDRLPQP